NVGRIKDVAALLPDIPPLPGVRYDVWLKVQATDASGNSREKEIKFPIRIDERPSCDIVSPGSGAKIVECSQLAVNVNRYDDVGIDSLRLRALQGPSEKEIYNVKLKQGPYQFAIDVPAFDATDGANNVLKLAVEAIDTYGVRFDDPDQHRATE